MDIDSALGLIEMDGFVPLVEATDAMTKGANVKLLHYVKVGKGRAAVIVQGELGAVREAIELGESIAQRHGRTVAVVLGNAAPTLKQILGIPPYIAEKGGV
jgi:microcompartment protein CcmL/EutN